MVKGSSNSRLRVEEGLTVNRPKGLFGGDVNVLKLDCGDVCTNFAQKH